LSAKQITVERDYGECPSFQGSPGELKQVIANLISNAADAVAVHGTVKVVISAAPATGLQLRIEDDGPGIANGNLHRIFEPFFTTKEDVGTGLGLWVAKEIVERHGGTIHADSGRPGALAGAVFTVSIPLAASETALGTC
jgi:signal transduction histidine kinase